MKNIILVALLSLFTTSVYSETWVESGYNTARIAPIGELLGTVIKDKPKGEYITISIWRSKRIMLRCIDRFNSNDVEISSTCLQLK